MTNAEIDRRVEAWLVNHEREAFNWGGPKAAALIRAYEAKDKAREALDRTVEQFGQKVSEGVVGFYELRAAEKALVDTTAAVERIKREIADES